MGRFIRGFKYNDISADLGNLPDSPKIFMDMNSLILADVDCYQDSLHSNDQHKLRLRLAKKQEATTNLFVIWPDLLLRIVCFTHGSDIAVS